MTQHHFLGGSVGCFIIRDAAMLLGGSHIVFLLGFRLSVCQELVNLRARICDTACAMLLSCFTIPQLQLVVRPNTDRLSENRGLDEEVP